MVVSEEVQKQISLKKRKQRSNEEAREVELQRSPKSSRLNYSERNDTEQLIELEKGKLELNAEEGSSWGNLHLILSLQNKNIDIPAKIKLAFDYVKSKTLEEEDGNSITLETVSLSRVLVFVNNWIQTVLISSVKKVRDEECKDEPETISSCLDCRCWVIFNFCLEKSQKLNVFLTIQRDFLKIMHFIARNMLFHLNGESSNFDESVSSSEGFVFQDIVLSSVSMVFSSHGVLGENLELWIMLIDAVLKLLKEVIAYKLDDDRTSTFVLQLSSYLFEPFAKFLKVHPTRKNNFGVFIDRIIEPIMHLLDDLNHMFFKNPGLTKNLLKLVQEVLSQGLFHPTHIDGFLSLQSTSKCRTADDRKSKDGIMVNKSYHRHLFDKLEKIIAKKNVLTVTGMGELLHLFVSCVVEQKGDSCIKECSRHFEGRVSGHYSERSYGSDNSIANKELKPSVLDVEKRMAIFDFFVQVMKYFLFQIEAYDQTELEVINIVKDVPFVFRSMNKLLHVFKEENIYFRIEDTSEGGCINFLSLIFETVLSFTDILIKSLHTNKEIQIEVMISIMKEVVASIHCLLDIEYKVIGVNLDALWRMALSFSVCSESWMDAAEYHVVTAEILHLGCHLIDLYKELRQVNDCMFSLCEAVRHLVLPLRNNEADNSSIYCAYANSLSRFLCSPEFRSSVCSAVKSIPEGLASECIQDLTADVDKSLEWLSLQSQPAPVNDLSTLNYSNSFFLLDLQSQLLGRHLSEVYTLILDSITVTTGNSDAVGVSVKELMTVIVDRSRALDSLGSGRIFQFFSIISGRTSGGSVGLEICSLSRWLLVFFFRLYLSCRSLNRLITSFVNPDASEAMADNFTAYSGKDWLDGMDQKPDGYFSWIIQPSPSLLDVVESVSNNYLQDICTCPPLVYLLNAMALQGLVDLNRKINSYKYLLVKNNKFLEINIIDDSEDHKRHKKCMKHILHLEQEAAGLTKFILGCASSLVKRHISEGGCSLNGSVQNLQKDGWDLSVGALNEKSLPSALWLIICQNIDIWCAYAVKKELKKFLKLLIQLSVPCLTCGFNEPRSNNIYALTHPKYITAHQVSLGLLQDTVLYEQKLVRRHIASGFHKVLKMSVSSVFPNLDKVDLNLLPDCFEIIEALEITSTDVFSGKDAKNRWMKQNYYLCNNKEFSPSGIKYAAWLSLLNLMNWMPKGYLNSKSLSLLATCIINLERIVVSSLLGWHSTFSLESPLEHLRLFLSCRRTLKNLLMASTNEMSIFYHSSLTCIFSEELSPILWLLKSLIAVTKSRHFLFKDIASQVEDMLFSLMDHTSYIFMIMCKDHLKHAIHSSNEISQLEPAIGGDVNMTEHKIESELRDHDPWKSIILLAENFREQMESSLVHIKGVCDSKKVGGLTVIYELIKLSPVICCIQGFLWGLASGPEKTGPESWSSRLKLAKSEAEPLYRLDVYIDECTHFVNYFINLLLLKDEVPSTCQPSGQAHNISESDNVLERGEDLHEISFDVNDGSAKELNSGLLENSLAVHDINGESKTKDCFVKKTFKPHIKDLDSLLAKIQMFDVRYLNISLLQGFMRGENLETAHFLRHMFFASSAILRLKMQINCSLLQNLIAVLIGTSRVLLFEFGHKVGESSPFSIVLLDGVIKFLEELGSWFPLSNPLSSRNLYAQLIDLHLMAIGKCIALQGKRANMASKGSGIPNKYVPSNWSDISDSIHSFSIGYLDQLKAKLRVSFRVLIQKSSSLHLLTAVQTIERAVVGVKESFVSNYEIHTDISNGGSVSSIVAAGVDCLDLFLEFLPGRKRLNVIRRHIQSLVASLFNIILHLQGPCIFTGHVNSSERCAYPDSGSIVLMCIEVLTKISGKHALFQMESCHIVQALHVPATLFQNYLRLRQSEVFGQYELQSGSGTRYGPLMGTNILDQQYSMDLYVVCCRLLCTVVKHHKSGTQHCAAILKDTVTVLLHCLEMVNVDPVSEVGRHKLETQRGLKCASCLRRVYEELRQQKDTFGCYCIHFLSCYIWVYCGYGPLKAGIQREIDEVLRPGIYALIDACSVDDLQYLHSVFGEGPCRSTLGTLQNDYKTNYQYEGKV